MIAEVLRALERFLLPNACVACDGLVESRRADELVCTVCRARLRPLAGGCQRCGQPLPPVGPCRFCAAWPASLRWVRSAVWLGDEAREIIHHLKYNDLPALSATVAHVVQRFVPRPSAGLLVPVPLGQRRLRARAYNQAAVIADVLGAAWDRPVARDVLRRRRDTRTQTALSPEERTANVRDAFEAARGPRRRCRTAGREGWTYARDSLSSGAARATSGDRVTVILIDDVLTTGATLAAAAHALAARGWPAIGAVTFARARPYALRAVG